MSKNHIALIALTGLLVVGRAQANCDNSSLDGTYAFKVQGATIGVLDSAGALHPLDAPQPTTAVGQYTFDGNGGYTRIDFAVGNGLPAIGAATPLTGNGFRTGQTGTYAISGDCTGNMVLNIPGGQEIDFAIVLVDYGQGVLGVVKSEHIPSLPVVPSGTTCAASSGGCQIGVNLLIELTKNMPRRR